MRVAVRSNLRTLNSRVLTLGFTPEVTRFPLEKERVEGIGPVASRETTERTCKDHLSDRITGSTQSTEAVL